MKKIPLDELLTDWDTGEDYTTKFGWVTKYLSSGSELYIMHQLMNMLIVACDRITELQVPATTAAQEEE